MTGNTIDNTNFMILKCLNDAEKPLWKNKVHERLMEIEDEMLLTGGVSVQTIGRRVDHLNNEGYVSNAIVSPDELKRDLIIAFKLTEDGKAAIREKREQLLKELVREQMFSKSDASIDHNALVELVGDEFDVGEDEKRNMQDDYTKEELITFLAMYFSKKEAAAIFDKERISQFRELISAGEEIPDMVTIAE